MEVDLPRRPPYLVRVDSSGSFGIHSSPGILLAWRRTPDSALTTRKESEWECLVISANEPAPTSPTSLWVHQRSKRSTPSMSSLTTGRTLRPCDRGVPGSRRDDGQQDDVPGVVHHYLGLIPWQNEHMLSESGGRGPGRGVRP
jgi:hypothetical protein